MKLNNMAIISFIKYEKFMDWSRVLYVIKNSSTREYCLQYIWHRYCAMRSILKTNKTSKPCLCSRHHADKSVGPGDLNSTIFFNRCSLLP